MYPFLALSRRSTYNECATYMKSNIGQTITIYEMCDMARKTYLKAMTHSNIISGLKKGFAHDHMRLLAKNIFSQVNVSEMQYL